jgi:hypothetical protein
MAEGDTLPVTVKIKSKDSAVCCRSFHYLAPSKWNPDPIRGRVQNQVITLVSENIKCTAKGEDLTSANPPSPEN